MRVTREAPEQFKMFFLSAGQVSSKNSKLTSSVSLSCWILGYIPADQISERIVEYSGVIGALDCQYQAHSFFHALAPLCRVAAFEFFSLLSSCSSSSLFLFFPWCFLELEYGFVLVAVWVKELHFPAPSLVFFFFRFLSFTLGPQLAILRRSDATLFFSYFVNHCQMRWRRRHDLPSDPCPYSASVCSESHLTIVRIIRNVDVCLFHEGREMPIVSFLLFSLVLHSWLNRAS